MTSCGFSPVLTGGPREWLPTKRIRGDHANISGTIGSKLREARAFARALLHLLQPSLHSSCLVVTVVLGMTMAASFIWKGPTCSVPLL